MRVKRSKSTSWPCGLACFKLRDSCMRISYTWSLIGYSDAKYGCAVLGFFYYQEGKTWNFLDLLFLILLQAEHF